MSSMMVVTPLVVASWPLLSAAITAAVGTMGFAAAQSAAHRPRVSSQAKARAEIELEDSEILAGSGAAGEQMVVERDGVRAIFSRDARGALKLCVEGENLSKAELRQLGEALVGRVAQQYAYHRLVTELKERQMPILSERVGEDNAIHIRVKTG